MLVGQAGDADENMLAGLTCDACDLLSGLACEAGSLLLEGLAYDASDLVLVDI